MTDAAARMTPPLDDLNREFWTGGASGQLRLTRCVSCRRWVFPLSAVCPGCDGSTEYEAVSGRGTVFSYTTNAHPYNPAVPLPYNISIVELDDQEGLRFMTNVVDCPPEDVRIGMPVHVVFEQHGEVFVPLFAPDS
ncbi:MAG TPA: OB-fold domain-containing protein [Acidimicrobiales bacterium]|nr:OB-fold domain-containing protein [Acidimicrobiales bacterium]